LPHSCFSIESAENLTNLNAAKDLKAQKDLIMHYHESVGLLMGIVVIPRLALRMMTPTHLTNLPGNSALQNIFEKLSHIVLLAMAALLPATGLAFGYFSCWGVPFFKWNVPGAKGSLLFFLCPPPLCPHLFFSPLTSPPFSVQNQFIEDWTYWGHHQLGKGLKYLLSLHMFLAFYHYAKGNRIFHRVNPFVDDLISSLMF
jgi:cytochrome b561